MSGSGVRRGAATLALACAAVGAPATAAPLDAPELPFACGIAVEQADRAVLAGVAPSARGAFGAAVGRLGGRTVGQLARIGAVEVLLPSPAAVPGALAALRAVRGVRWAEPEHVVRARKTSNDPMRRYQWGLGAISAYGAWDRETGRTADVTVAVIDTGIDLEHPDLAGRATDGTNQFGGTSSQDDNGHGTHVAGIVGAATNNRVGVAGVSWGADLLAIKALDQKGAGTDCSAVNGYLDAVDAGADVVNMSLGSDNPCPIAFQLAIRYGAESEVVPVAAAGNSGDKGNPVESPASCDGVLAVGAVDSRGRVAAFSGHQPYVAVCAPGVNVVSTYFDAKKHQHVYASASGTSMAAPYVSGLAALLLAKHPSWTSQQVRDRIVATARDLGAPGRDDYYGAGRIDAARALS